MSVGACVRQYRTARGYTLDELVTRMDGIVTKQALSKYENDRAVPRPRVLVAIATALDVKPARLVGDPGYRFEVVAYRALASLSNREAEHIENVVQLELEQRLTLMDRLGLEHSDPFAGSSRLIHGVSETEEAASGLRDAWDLGGGPISNVVDTLESQGVHVVEIDTQREFDGLAMFAFDDDDRRVVCGIAVRSETSRARQRLSDAHELGHLAMRVGEGVDAEKAARRFAGAFLYPSHAVVAEFGSRRSRVTQDELFGAKRRWGLSMQAVLYRLHDLQILDDAGYVWWCTRINQVGWRENEPGDEPSEHSCWGDIYAYRAAAEGVIAAETLAEYVPRSSTRTVPEDIDRRALVRLPAAERKSILLAQAEEFAEQYADSLDHEWLGANLGDQDHVDE